APTLWAATAPRMDPARARLELARRYFHVFGPTTAASFAQWAGISARGGVAAFEALDAELIPARTPVGDAWILSSDETVLRAAPEPAAPARLLPSGDAFFLCHRDEERALLVPDAARRQELWTSRVWPGCLLVDGEIVGTWRRAAGLVTGAPWRPLSRAQREAVEAESQSLPLGGVEGSIVVRWT
ncbi:MAG TPA: crosslink repair DNA glycosylase YcaQ family protein, partial [Chloroflexota bacterium]|nr:crosslink repair DNA glycosylase YcaQ family protein [Chloroflexota bacterium]